MEIIYQIYELEFCLVVMTTATPAKIQPAAAQQQLNQRQQPCVCTTVAAATRTATASKTMGMPTKTTTAKSRMKTRTPSRRKSATSTANTDVIAVLKTTTLSFSWIVHLWTKHSVQDLKGIASTPVQNCYCEVMAYAA